MDDNKTEKPSSRKLEKAREKGQTAFSKDLQSFLSLLIFFIIFSSIGPFFIKNALNILKNLILTETINVNLLYNLFFLMLIPMLLICISGALLSWIQNGFIFTTDTIKFNLEKISPLKGISRVFSTNAVVEFLKNLLKLIAISLALYLTLYPKFGFILNSYQYSLLKNLNLLFEIFKKILTTVLIMLGILGIIDFFYQKYSFLLKMKMSKEETKQEYKEQEGSPEIKSKRHSVMVARFKKRLNTAVKKSTVIVTNPTHYAIGLEYNENMAAPKITAKGKDLAALAIRELAKEYKIPIVRRPNLAQKLFRDLKIDDYILKEHYVAVAEVIMYVMKLK